MLYCRHIPSFKKKNQTIFDATMSEEGIWSVQWLRAMHLVLDRDLILLTDEKVTIHFNLL